jgi:hypothetical protein
LDVLTGPPKPVRKQAAEIRSNDNARIQPKDPASATGKAKERLSAVQAKIGIIPKLMKTLANSPAALEAYLTRSGALSHGLLDAKYRERSPAGTYPTNPSNAFVNPVSTMPLGKSTSAVWAARTTYA